MAVKASQEDQARLLELQAIDTRLQQLAHRGTHLPEQATLDLLVAESELLRAGRSLENGVMEDARAELSRVESDVAVVEARIARDSARLQTSSSVKDVAGLESELAGLRRRLGELEEIELAVMERIEELETAAASTVHRHDELLARVGVVESERDTALAALDSERGHAAANRQTIVGGLPPHLVELYERQRSRYGFGASHLRGGVSSASGVRLLENELAVIRSAAPDDVLICPDSQAILVRTGESGI